MYLEKRSQRVGLVTRLLYLFSVYMDYDRQRIHSYCKEHYVQRDLEEKARVLKGLDISSYARKSQKKQSISTRK